MKKLFLLLIAFSMKATAQTTDFDVVFSGGIDPKMATVGAHPDREGNKPSLDYEFSFGFDFPNTRILMQLKSHSEIHFLKWTYIQFDYKKEIIESLYAYGGLEFGQIKKDHRQDADFGSLTNYREFTINPLIFGLNLELQYKFYDNRFGAGLQFGMYQSEDELKPYKKYRKDITATLFLYL